MKKYLIVLALVQSFIGVTQEKKETTTLRSTSNIKINGQLDESIWETITSATGFKMLRPDNGPEAPNTHKTEVKVLYDDNAIYIGAILYDNDANAISREFSQRDNVFVEADVFTVAINTFNDGINENKFYVTAAGTQADSKTRQGGWRTNDYNWSAVWESAVSITDVGWVVEIKIPYSALRFQNTNVQTWGINFMREIKRRDEIYSWNYVDRSVGNESQYNGILNGITNIKPPVRLSFFPFVSAFSETTEGNTKTKITAGLDLKYGITENFTLDATVIPDFSQTGFDPLSLNLGPFEQTFREQRQFFTEGVQLFNKGGLFFSRRIGGRPSESASTSDGEEIIDSPSEVKVLNVFKISGRTKNGLGIGFLDAITGVTEATIKNTITNTSRKEVIEPLTNYNVLVIDQQFNDNSSVSLVNTNVSRNGHFRDANVTALVYDLSTKSNTFNLEGDFKFSSINDIETINGFSANLEFRKTSGNFRYDFEYRMADDKFDINDVGRQRRNNFSNFSGGVSYQKFTPQGRFNNYRVSLSTDMEYLYSPNVYTEFNLSLRSHFRTKKQLSYSFGVYLSPAKTHDYFEARIPDHVFVKNSDIFLNSDFNTDNGKKISSRFTLRYNKRFNDDESGFSFAIRPQIRVSNHFKINYSLDGGFDKSEPGYITTTDTDILFGRRDVREIENSVRFTYNHNTKHAIGLNFRNYWSTVQYKNRYFTLEEDGSLATTKQQPDYNPDTNFNVWNLDLNYSWQFAPGSQAVFLYRNSIFQNTEESTLNYLASLDNLLKQPFTHIFSLKITYYLDYLNLKNMFKKKNS
ncbi:MAG: DUF5916 domain-containing protein [Cellulophaga sp.]